MDKIVSQTWKKKFKDKKDIAKKYFSMLCIYNDIKLTEKELDLLSHIAIKKTISSINSRKEFIQIYDTTMPVINNLISKLYKKHMLIKVDGKIRINPKININFEELDNLVLKVCLYQNESKKE